LLFPPFGAWTNRSIASLSAGLEMANPGALRWSATPLREARLLFDWFDVSALNDQGAITPTGS
jgi:hypothetical protein